MLPPTGQMLSHTRQMLSLTRQMLPLSRQMLSLTRQMLSLTRQMLSLTRQIPSVPLPLLLHLLAFVSLALQPVSCQSSNNRNTVDYNYKVNHDYSRSDYHRDSINSQMNSHTFGKAREYSGLGNTVVPSDDVGQPAPHNTRYSEVSTRISESVDAARYSEWHVGAAAGRNTYQYSGITDHDRDRGTGTSSGRAVAEQPLKLEGVDVPVYKFRGEDAQLECKYNKGTDPLYSVKWYKDDNEFFRYLYRQLRPKQVFDMPGVIVDINRSNERRVLLRNLTFSSTGIYRCEVSADSPHFRTYTNQSVMVVVELPSQPPSITGGRSHYKVGDTARLNCTSASSKPAPTLTWYINGVEAAPHQLEQYYPWVHRDQLESKRLGLTFQVREEHFGPDGELEVRCRATVSAVYREGDVPEAMPVVLEHREDLIRARNAASRSQDLILHHLMLLVMVAAAMVRRPC